MWLFLLLLIVPIIEIALFIEVGGWLGLWPTLAIVILTAVAGTYLLRHQGLAALAELKRRAEAGGDPGPVILDGLAILVAGIVLLTPGFFTDAIGFALLIPPVRQSLMRWLGRRIVVAATAAASQQQHRGRPRQGETIDGEWEEIPPEGRDREHASTLQQDRRDEQAEDGGYPRTGSRPSGWTRGS